jgi:hypothetical protein
MWRFRSVTRVSLTLLMPAQSLSARGPKDQCPTADIIAFKLVNLFDLDIKLATHVD